MTRLKRTNRGSGHSYTIDGQPVPGVTTVTGTLAKPGLVSWAAREAAGYAIEHWSELSDLPLMERARRIENARNESRDAKATRGKRIHGLGDRLARGAEVEVPDELRGPVEAYARFLDRWDMESLASEAPVGHTGFMYAGTLDGIVRCPKLGTVLLDVKTGGRVYSEHSLQLAAYRFANVRQYTVETVGPRGGKRSEVRETEMIRTDGAYIAHVLPDDVQLIPVEADEAIWHVFLYLREVWEFAHRIDFKGENRPTLGEPIWPEDPARVAG